MSFPAGFQPLAAVMASVTRMMLRRSRLPRFSLRLMAMPGPARLAAISRTARSEPEQGRWPFSRANRAAFQRMTANGCPSVTEAPAAMMRRKAGVRRRSGFLWRGRGSGAGDADAGVAGGRLAGFGLAAAPCRRGGALRGCIRGRVPARWGRRMWRGPPRCLFGEALGEDRWVDAWRRRAHGKR